MVIPDELVHYWLPYSELFWRRSSVLVIQWSGTGGCLGGLGGTRADENGSIIPSVRCRVRRVRSSPVWND